ncbi:hypothetical protein PRIPAC_84131 [Pristionchus pacificus]|uniref:G protein-coupled receptor n=1 Tax=Pristionchus pacificus TaxID=54126 RepID=A0A2A6BRY3_PRIPA|nr:hypothetical protein PRIPAC_84131 [Pristionchus pacificus]|eukprot:PDM68627.1 G protein-coupled receptor [Pristionchus pacificus]
MLDSDIRYLQKSMHSTEPGASFEIALVYFQHLNGVIMLVLNGSIVMLIIRDEDHRNKHYRKYMCCLQISSLVVETFSDFYAPIVQYHKGIFYSNSYLSNFVGAGTFMATELFLFAEVLLIYFACIYYRRGIILGRDRFFNYFGWNRIVFYIFNQVYVFVAIGTMVFYMNNSVKTAELHWAKNRTSHVFIKPDANMIQANYIGASATIYPAIAISFMLWQLISEVKKGMPNASSATKRYQHLAVRSLLLQGAVPALVYLIPSFANTGLQISTTFFELGETFDRTAMVLSPILYIFMTKHTFANSLTLLYCSPSYRRKIITAIRGSSDTVYSTILLIFNSSIIILIIIDDDKRNEHYRKYLCCVQTIELVLLAEVVLSYFACVYYRRGLVLGPERRFNYTGWRRVAIFLFVQVYGLTAVIGMVYFTAKSVQESEQFLPDEVHWVRNRTSYMFMLPNENEKYATYGVAKPFVALDYEKMYVSAPIADSVALAAIGMLVQLVIEVKKGSFWSSASTRRYQRLAVRSLILQGAVPSLLYVVPSYANTCLQFAPTVFDCGERFNRFATVLSPILWITITKHTFASSLTILYCSPSYRRRIVAIITRRSDLTPQSFTESTRDREIARCAINSLGVALFVFNSFVILLIIIDDDSRNKHYRKYLCFVLSVEVVLLTQVVYSYFACVYYRRSIFLDPSRGLNYRGKQRIWLLGLVQVYAILVAAGTIYFMSKSMQSAESLLPSDMLWARLRTKHLYMHMDENVRFSALVSYPAGVIFTFFVIVMLKQLVREVKSGVRKSSVVTSRYQLLAVRSLILQGAVPSLVYLVPSQGNTFLQFAPSVFDCGKNFDRIASYISPILLFVMTKHTFVCSLTILYCSPSYRTKIMPVSSLLFFSTTIINNDLVTIISPINWVVMTKHTFVSSLTILYCSQTYRRKIVMIVARSNNHFERALTSIQHACGDCFIFENNQ